MSPNLEVVDSAEAVDPFAEIEVDSFFDVEDESPIVVAHHHS